MNLEEIRELIRMMKDNGLSEIDIESTGERVRLRATESSPPAVQDTPPTLAPAAPTPATEAAEAIAAPPASEPEKTEEAPAPEGVVIKSPIVGMFYRAPASDKPPYANVGDEIDEDSVLCIIEAMKVMNEIKAETGGVIAEVCCKDGEAIEFGQVLFKVRP